MKSTAELYSDIQTEFVTANGIRFEVDQCGDQASRKLAICLHGFPEHAISWRHQMPMLANKGYKVWAPNLRGYGNSSMPPEVDDYRIETLIEDVAALIDAADCDETVLVAHDWGAVIAWYLAMRQTRPLTHLIICNVPHPAAMQASMGWSQIRKSWYAFFFQLPWLPEFLFTRTAGDMGEMIRRSSARPELYPDEVINMYSDNAARPGAMKAMINYYRALVRGGGSKRQKALGYPVIDVPTLMVWGEDDVALTKETTFGTGKWVSDLTIRYLPRVSHWVQQDAPEETNAMMDAFLEGKPVPEMIWESKLVESD